MKEISKVSIDLLNLRSNEGLPSDQTFITTNNLVNKLYNAAKINKLWWYPPQMGMDYDGTVFLDWWHNKKRYSIFILEDRVNYIAYWGMKTDEETEHGDINIESNLLDFWSWIAE